MAGIYFHIPFCKQACHYCDFHFSTSLKYRDEMLAAISRELSMQSGYFSGSQAKIETIYFGGGTPSLLHASDLNKLIDAIAGSFDIHQDAEITIEANPDDLNDAYVQTLRTTPINRFSIGIQSFYEEDLRWMNRAHNAIEARQAILRVQDAGYAHITADLIYGYPLLSAAKWQSNIGRLLDFGIPHISAYGMTVEPKTALATFIRKGKQPAMDESQSADQFEYLMDTLTASGFIHYEISNFARPEHYARHNSNYWRGQPYLGLGPSAHSYNGRIRQWNVSNNARYMQAIQNGTLPCEQEELTNQDLLNEYIMTSLRTIWGLNLELVEHRFGSHYRTRLGANLQPFLKGNEVVLTGQLATLTRKGKLLADHIASELFFD